MTSGMLSTHSTIASTTLMVIYLLSQRRQIHFIMKSQILKEVLSTAEPLICRENVVIINNDEIKKMKMYSLKAELRKCGLSTSGKKAELV